MDQNSVLESLQASVQNLKSSSLETNVLLGTYGYFISNLLLVAHVFVRRLQTSSNLAKEELLHCNQLSDLIRLSTNLAVKFSSKKEFSEVLTKHDKSQEQLNKLRDQFDQFALKYAQAFVVKQQSPIFQRFLIEYDYSLAIETLLSIKFYFEKYDKEKLAEHASNLSGLVDYFFNIRSNHLPKCLYWPMDSLQPQTLKEIKFLFPERHSKPETSRHTLTEDEKLEEVLKESFQTSYRGVWNGHFLCIKKIPSKRVFAQNEIGLRECLSLLENKNFHQSSYVIPLYGFSWDPKNENLYFLYPLAVERSLYDVFTCPTLLEKLPLSAEQKVSIIYDLIQAIKFLHEQGIIHGRIKDTNIFLDVTNYHVKLSDYGYQMFLKNEVKIQKKGNYGIRWTSPEIIQLETQYEELLKGSSTLSNADYQNLDHLLSLYSSYSLLPATDIYSVGILTLVLLTENIPFFNVEWDEAVKGQLSNNQLPYFTYSEDDVLRPLIDEILLPCIGSALTRPTVEELEKICEESYCSVVQRVFQKELVINQEQQVAVTEEIADLTTSIEEHKIIVTKGKELIARKEADKLNITDSKVRRERDLEIQKAKVKLVGFQEELEGLKDDKEGAEHDL
jgi:serine/threonine protein kinase